MADGGRFPGPGPAVPHALRRFLSRRFPARHARALPTVLGRGRRRGSAFASGLRLALAGALGAGAFGLAGCSPPQVILAAGTTAGLAVAEERSVGEQMSDASIKLRLNALWLEEMPDRYMDLGATVVERRVLVTGTVPTPEDRVEAIRLAWAVDGVRSVVNRVEVADSDGLGGFLRDSWISAQIESRLTFDTAVFSVNYTVDTVRGTVYLMGIAQDAEERRRVVGHARQVPYVRRIVDLTRLKGEPPPVPGTPPGDAGAIAAGASGSGSADSATSAVERRPLE